jgi:hypothetical protein
MAAPKLGWIRVLCSHSVQVDFSMEVSMAELQASFPGVSWSPGGLGWVPNAVGCFWASGQES